MCCGLTGARFNEASHVSISAVEMSANVRSGNAEQNLVRRNRRSLQYRALAPAARAVLEQLAHRFFKRH